MTELQSHVGHFQKICQFGFIHAQCRCPGRKYIEKVNCDVLAHGLNPVQNFMMFDGPSHPCDLSYHGMNLCEHGYIHLNCPCVDPKPIRRVSCLNPVHKTQPKIGSE